MPTLSEKAKLLIAQGDVVFNLHSTTVLQIAAMGIAILVIFVPRLPTNNIPLIIFFSFFVILGFMRFIQKFVFEVVRYSGIRYKIIKKSLNGQRYNSDLDDLEKILDEETKSPQRFDSLIFYALVFCILMLFLYILSNKADFLNALVSAIAIVFLFIYFILKK